MAADPRRGPSAAATERRLSPAESAFYARTYSSARRGRPAELCRAGCSEGEAEEFFQAAFERVMETVDPIERRFSPPQMVNFIKRAAWRQMIDERRRRGRRPEIEIGTVRSLSDTTAESPEEVAEEREAIAIGREALQMLPERDRLIFRQRHQMNLSPEEILQNLPGLSPRTYRKIIQRANTRVLDAFERIEGGSRCEEMEGGLLRRHAAGEHSETERLEVEAHLAHCRACQKAQARMRGYLFEVGGIVIAASDPELPGRLLSHGGLLARFADLAVGGSQGLGELSRSARERVRELALRLFGGVGVSGDATVGQVLSATSVKVVSVCAAGVAAGACVAAGVVPGVGGIGLVGQDEAQVRARTPVPARTTPTERPRTTFEALPNPGPQVAKKGRRQRGSETSGRDRSLKSGRSSTRPSETLSEATESGSVVGSEFGAESTQPIDPTPPSSSAPPSGTGAGSGGHSGSIPQSGGSGEFGEF
jgi:RNA polymerase sigma factor (sigma-70 family)